MEKMRKKEKNEDVKKKKLKILRKTICRYKE